jgi:hypothetical protein
MHLIDLDASSSHLESFSTMFNPGDQAWDKSNTCKAVKHLLTQVSCWEVSCCQCCFPRWPNGDPTVSCGKKNTFFHIQMGDFPWLIYYQRVTLQSQTHASHSCLKMLDTMDHWTSVTTSAQSTCERKRDRRSHVSCCWRIPGRPMRRGAIGASGA